MMLVVYFRYSHFRISSSLKIRDLKKKIEEGQLEKDQMAQALKAEVKLENEQVKKLLRDLELFRKEKAEEMRLRLEAEKQIELAFQKTNEVERRLNDWKRLQDAAILDSKNAMFKVGAELYQKMSQTHREESEQSRNVMEKTMKNVYSHLEVITKNLEEVKKKAAQMQVVQVAANKGSAPMAAAVEAQTRPASAPIVLDEFTKRKLTSIASLMKDSGFKINKDYVTAEALDAEKNRYMLCDLIFVREGVIHFIDFKSMRYLQEFEKAKATNKSEAVKALSAKLDKYLAYLSNPKYLAALKKLAADLGIKYSKVKTVLAAASHDDVSTLKALKYLEKAQASNVEVMDADSIGDLAL